MPELNIYPSNAALPEHLSWQIQAAVRTWWYDNYTQGDIAEDAPLPKHWNPAHVVMTRGKAVIAFAGIVHRPLTHDGTTYTAYGLSSVYTFPFFRGQGHGHRIVAAATQWIDDAVDADIAVLFTSRKLAEGFYAPLGWQPMLTTTFLVGEPDSPRPHEQAPAMRFLSDRGRAARTAFENAEVYFAPDPW